MMVGGGRSGPPDLLVAVYILQRARKLDLPDASTASRWMNMEEVKGLGCYALPARNALIGGGA